jgi:hypothetical protein
MKESSDQNFQQLNNYLLEEKKRYDRSIDFKF